MHDVNDETGPEPHVLRWESPTDASVGHQILTELQARPGEWAVVWEEGTVGRPWDEEDTATYVCINNSRVELYAVRGHQDERYVRIYARWIPEKPKPRAQFIPYSDHERQMAYGTGL